ncbi:unnamed protein product [Aphanomyces euteiches]
MRYNNNDTNNDSRTNNDQSHDHHDTENQYICTSIVDDESFNFIAKHCNDKSALYTDWKSIAELVTSILSDYHSTPIQSA